jgi:hypothetical protein
VDVPLLAAPYFLASRIARSALVSLVEATTFIDYIPISPIYTKSPSSFLSTNLGDLLNVLDRFQSTQNINTPPSHGIVPD